MESIHGGWLNFKHSYPKLGWRLFTDRDYTRDFTVVFLKKYDNKTLCFIFLYTRQSDNLFKLSCLNPILRLYRVGFCFSFGRVMIT